MKDKNHILLRKAVQELPEMEPESSLWNNIEAQLDFEETLTQMIPLLPLLEPEKDSWAKLESQLPYTKKADKQATTIHLFTYISAAAFILLIIAAGIFFLKSQAGTPTLSYSQEVSYVEAQINFPEGHEAIQEALGFIHTTCESQLLVCRTPQFQELKSQLDDLSMEMQFLKQQQALYGQEPELIKAQIKLENLQAEITKELIQLIVS